MLNQTFESEFVLALDKSEVAGVSESKPPRFRPGSDHLRSSFKIHDSGDEEEEENFDERDETRVEEWRGRTSICFVVQRYS